MFDQEQLNQFKTKIKDANSVLILLPPDPDTDSLSGALGLHLSLKQAGKSSTIGCSSRVKVGDSHLFGIDQVKENIGNRNLVVSFDYKEESAENVSYDIDEATGKFNLRIKPKDGADPLDSSSISYSYTGAQADLVITFGITSLEELGRLYSEEKEFLDQANLANLSIATTSIAFAGINLSNNKATSISELVTHLLKITGISPTADAATNLYNQLLSASENFQSPKVTADTFEIAAFLLRSGAQKSTPKPQAEITAPTFFTPPPTTPQSENTPSTPSINDTSKGVPADWTGPKIYRGSNLR